MVMKSIIFWDIMWSWAPLVTCFHAGILLGSFFDPENGGDMFLRNGCFSVDYTMLYLRI
jgi:hypothetical protein